MVQTATNTFYNGEQEKEAKAQEKETNKETRHAQMLATLLRSPMANPESLKDKAQSVDRWDIGPECPNHDKSPKMACYKCHQLGHWVAPCPWVPRALRSSTKLSIMMIQHD